MAQADPHRLGAGSSFIHDDHPEPVILIAKAFIYEMSQVI